jgi:hypothetical protein
MAIFFEQRLCIFIFQQFSLGMRNLNADSLIDWAVSAAPIIFSENLDW